MCECMPHTFGLTRNEKSEEEWNAKRIDGKDRNKIEQRRKEYLNSNTTIAAGHKFILNSFRVSDNISLPHICYTQLTNTQYNSQRLHTKSTAYHSVIRKRL